MSIRLSGQKAHNGFLLSEPFVHQGNLIVLTGLNGSGKTRLLESIKQGLSVAQLDGEQVTRQDIVLIEQSGLKPNFGGAYDDAQFETKITSSLRLFDHVKHDFDAPYDQDKAIDRRGMQQGGALPYESLYRLCNSIASHLNKLPSQLTHDEIKIYFEDHVNSVLGFQNISLICNHYIKRKKLNRYYKFCSEQDGDDVAFLTDEEFLDRFGSEPWRLLNNIVKGTFDDKFHFSEPDERSQSYSYNATLIQRDTSAPVTVEALSSGEKTLLWLALTLFNCQYCDQALVKTPRLLLLDEPDAFLHPKMVVKMYQALDAFAASFKSRIIITTHSPTTVALAPENGTYIVNENVITSATKDEGVAELLDGVTQISISPENRRQVFVESQYDADVYQAIYSKLVHRFDTLDSKISLNFISSGPKMPEQQLKDKVKQILGISDEKRLDEFTKSLNGVGNCVQVIGQVEALAQNDNKTVRGIIDWDLKNEPQQKISVLAAKYAYSIENLTLDPVCILLLLHTNEPDSLTMCDICGSDVHWTEWLKNDGLLQESVDRFVKAILGRGSRKDTRLEYTSGKVLMTDSGYLTMGGHALEMLVKEKYPALRGLSRSGKDGELKYAIVSKSMINMTNGDFIPRAFEQVLSMVQK